MLKKGIDMALPEVSPNLLFPKEENILKRSTAVEFLAALLLGKNYIKLEGRSPVIYSSKAQTRLILALTRAYGLDLWDNSSPIFCTLVGSFSESTFFSIACSQLQYVPLERESKILRFDMMERYPLVFEIDEVEFRIQYYQSGEDLSMGLPKDNVRNMNAQYEHSSLLKEKIVDYPSFQYAFSFIRSWARLNGVYSARFGYLSEDQLAVMIATVYQSNKELGLDPSEIIFRFFRHYAKFSFPEEVVYDRQQYRDCPSPPRVSNNVTSVLTGAVPCMNFAQHVSHCSIETLKYEFDRASKLENLRQLLRLSDSNPTSNHDLNASRALPVQDFIIEYQMYIKIEVQYWGPSKADTARYLDWLDGKVPELVEELSKPIKATSTLRLRAWPERLSTVPGNGLDCPGPQIAIQIADYRAFYLVGVGSKSPRPLQELESRSIRAVASAYGDRLREDTFYKGRALNAWVGISVERGDDLAGSLESKGEKIMPDERQWGPVVDERIRERLEDFQKLEPVNNAVAAPERPSSSEHIGGKLRPAMDVLNRLKHDPAIDKDDYVVGYEDRHLGIQELPVSLWKVESTDEEFIPQHRIQYFKRISDGTVVWDRRKKFDRIFISG